MKEIATPDQTTGELFRPRHAGFDTRAGIGGFATIPLHHGHESEAGGRADELLRHLDAEISMQRARRKAPARNRALFLVSGVLFIVGAAAAALMMLEEMVSGQVREGRGTVQAQAESGRNF